MRDAYSNLVKCPIGKKTFWWVGGWMNAWWWRWQRQERVQEECGVMDEGRMFPAGIWFVG
jgi:hypothetical protein